MKLHTIQCSVCGNKKETTKPNHINNKLFVECCPKCRMEKKQVMYDNSNFKIKCPICGSIKSYVNEAFYKKALTKPVCNSCNWKQKIIERSKTINHSIAACKFMDSMNETGTFYFKHARNGGEQYVPICAGFFLDGFDPINNIVFEWDEPYHELPENKSEDISRQNMIFSYFKDRNINVRFIRYSELNKVLYEVFPS